MAIDNDLVTLFVGEEGEVLFKLPRKVLCSHSRYLARLLGPSPVPSKRNAGLASGPSEFELPMEIRPCDFHDFTLWLRNGRILQIPHRGAEYAVEYSARKLIDALRLAHIIASEDYQSAALQELHCLGQALPWPEDFVNQIFEIPNVSHSAQRLIANIVAARTYGKDKRRIRLGPREPGFDRGDSIKGNAFWEMYREVCRHQTDEYSTYPPSGEMVIQV
ncbi:hypothetical protein HII31_02398 [Pseudocercospora fuligena]|uniref:BTB domain-containing protein n=1 Tax=Pseudocercospora fuligena TaxID=685502 RepID=A0A8H6RSH2_9PEZI|nr:hypothetical protein HII31_02398 [Pseudocercospora fuligena]